MNVWLWWRRHWPQLVIIGGVFASALYVCLHWSDADFGWHYQSGRYILAHGVPMHDIFTYTAASYPWVNHEWLNDVVLASVGSLGGYLLIAWLYAGLWALGFGLASRWRSSVLVMSLSLAALTPYLGIRSLVWSAVGFAVALRLVKHSRRWPLFPLLFALWANLHGGFALGLVVLAIYVAWLRSWRLAMWLAGSVLATFANPYGWRLYGEIWQTMTDSQLHGKIIEWWPLAIDPTNAPFIVAAVALVLAVRFDMPRRLLGGILLLATLQANRQLPFLVLALQEPMEQALERFKPLLQARWPRLVAAGAGSLTLATISLVAVALFWPLSSSSAQALTQPYRSAAVLRSDPCRGQLFNHYSFGGYLIWQLPGQRVYIDGRMPSWSNSEGNYLARWERVMSDPGYADEQFARYGVQCAVITKTDHVLNDHLSQQGWRRVMTEKDAVLWRRD